MQWQLDSQRHPALGCTGLHQVISLDSNKNSWHQCSNLNIQKHVTLSECQTKVWLWCSILINIFISEFPVKVLKYSPEYKMNRSSPALQVSTIVKFMLECIFESQTFQFYLLWKAKHKNLSSKEIDPAWKAKMSLKHILSIICMKTLVLCMH